MLSRLPQILSYFGKALKTSFGALPFLVNCLVSCLVMSSSFANSPNPIQPTIQLIFDPSIYAQKNVHNWDYCLSNYTPSYLTASGKKIKMLGVAMVYMGPSNGISIFGHLAERFVYCIDDKLFDLAYEYVPNSKESAEIKLTPDMPIALQENYQKAVVVHLMLNPVLAYAQEQNSKNRSIYETWLSIDETSMHKLLVSNVDRLNEQTLKIKNHELLTEYKVMSDNCQKPVLQDLEIANPGYILKHDSARLTPGFFYSKIKTIKDSTLIIYPSQRMYRLQKFKNAGKSTFFENITFLSQASPQSQSPNSHQPWMLIYPEAESRLGKFFIHPIGGAFNVVGGAVEIAFGAVTIPFDLILRAVARTSARPMINKIGFKRMGMGVGDVILSLSEMVYLRARYPVTTPWTEEEIDFFKNFTENSALLETLKAKWKQEPPVTQILTNEDSRLPLRD